MSPFVATLDRIMMDGAARLVGFASRNLGANKFSLLREISTGRTMVMVLALLVVPYDALGFWTAAFVALAITRVPIGVGQWKALNRKAVDLDTVRGFEREVKRVGKAMAKHQRDAWVTVPFSLCFLAFFAILAMRSLALHGTEGMGVPLALWTASMCAGYFSSYVDLQPPAAPGSRREERMAAFRTVTAAR